MSVKKKKKNNRKKNSNNKNKNQSQKRHAVRELPRNDSSVKECKPELTLALDHEPVEVDTVDIPEPRLELAEKVAVDKTPAPHRGYRLFARAFGRESASIARALVERILLIVSIVIMCAAALVAVWLISGNRMREVDYGDDRALFVWHESEKETSGSLYFADNGRVDVEYLSYALMLRYKNGDVYIGDAIDFIPNGEGRMNYINGDRLEGWFCDGLPHGLATYTRADGEKYEGDFHYGVKSGAGKLTFADGSVYIGEFRDDRIEGKGEMRFASGDVCIGNFKNGVAQGSVSYLYASGDVYEGEFENGLAQGIGRMYYASGDVYEGEFKNNAINGFGKYTWADGTSYIGEFANGLAK